MGIINEIRQIELDNIRRDVQSDDYFGYIEGKIPVLISAPHGAKHFRARENRWKCEDAFTAAIAIKLGRLTGAHVIFVKNKTLEDPNNALRCRYKDLLGKIVREHGIKFVMDIHGAGSEYPFKIDVGILDGRADKSSCPTFKHVIEKCLEGFDRGIFNKRFRARDPGTITWFAWKKLGVESAQFEISARYRRFEDGAGCPLKPDERGFSELLGRLRSIVVDINRKVSGQAARSSRTGRVPA